MSGLVVARLTGGLGNQLFQYAAALGIAHRSGAEAAVDLTSFRRGEEKRSFALDRYDIGVPILAGSVFDADVRTAFLPAQADKGEMSLPVLRENTYEFEPETGKWQGSAYLYGFWQSWRYFAEIGDELRQRITLAASPTGHSIPENSTAVHVRRGDYLGGGGESFGLCEPSYYEAAMALMRERVLRPHFFVFSDDPEWCRAHFAARDVTIVSRPGGDAREDLAFMARCRHHIIANSSLSWWGAWLGAGAQSIMIAPIPWYTQSPQAGDLIPNHWIRLNRKTGADWSKEQPRVGGMVSVIVLARRGPDQLRQALVSIRAQSHQNIEIIVATGVQHGAALNAGIAKAQGEWIALLDDCDAWVPDKLRVQLETAALTGADAVNCRTIPVAGPDGLPPLYPPAGRPDCDLSALLRAGHFFAGVSHTIARREVLASLGPIDEGWSPATPSETWGRLLARPSTVMLWQRLVKSPIPWLALLR